jgi:hydroxymethylpyrimidine/phosphomethylpyrimidine kinase
LDIEETEALVGRTLSTWDVVRAAAQEVHMLGVANVVITAARRDEDTTVTDLLYDGRDFRELTAGRAPGGPWRGAGATFAAAVAASLAKGETVPFAATAAKAYVTKALQGAFSVGDAAPLHHFYRFWRPVE